MGIEVRNLSYIYMKNTPFEKKALDSICLTINDGDFMGLIGHTGCGKTTLIQHFNSLLKPTEGSVLIDGKDIKEANLKELRHKVGLVFQYPEHQLFEETVAKDIAYGIRKKGFSIEEIEEKVCRTICMVGLDKDILQKSVFDISGGEKRRVAIAGVLIMEPSILVLDEPAAGLDPSGKEGLFKILRELHETGKITIIFVSHNMEDIALLCNKVIVMNEGKIFMTGCVSEVFKKRRELNDVGLDIPRITKFMQALKETYPEINDNIYRMEEAKNELLKLFEAKNVR